ncbi:MAG: sigma-70 family RNA polymerase sigma factor [Puniceicoccales bacterium]|jgi:RNA polymerase sigma-70 factor (ECF subfamily)|nr:sigma-70 family RNA polymerase sigma factor [Puniceicoccales bacterium]
MALKSAPQSATAAWIDALVREHRAALLCYARNLVHDDATAQDIVQDTFLRLCQSPPDPAFARPWLFRVCRTRAIDWWRSHREHTLGSNTDEMPQTDFFERLPDPDPSPPENLVRDETAAALAQQIASLPPRQRELIRLKFQADLSYKEIATVTGLTTSNVGFILHSALSTLRRRATAL